MIKNVNLHTKIWFHLLNLTHLIEAQKLRSQSSRLLSLGSGDTGITSYMFSKLEYVSLLNLVSQTLNAYGRKDGDGPTHILA